VRRLVPGTCRQLLDSTSHGFVLFCQHISSHTNTTLLVHANTVTQHPTPVETCDKMRDRPTMCEWFRGCPNEVLIYYPFSDKWLCRYCIGYARIGVPLCAHDGWRRGTCVNAATQIWYCDLHGHRCDAIIERPPGFRTGNAHRCMQRARQDYDGHWYCAEHMPEIPDPRAPTPPPLTFPRWGPLLPPPSTATPPPLVFPTATPLPLPLPPPSPRPRPVSTNRSRRDIRSPRSMSNRPVSRPPTPVLRVSSPNVPLLRAPSPLLGSQPSLPRSLVARITSVITSLSSAFMSSGSDVPAYLTSVVHPFDRPTVPVSQTRPQIDLDVFSTVVDTECCICLEPQRSMRKLIACNHMFCEECLAKQVNGAYMRRHNCALCRKDMYDLRGSE
jgi:hypothetical protein